jgi:hypothetical protein
MLLSYACITSIKSMPLDLTAWPLLVIMHSNMLKGQYIAGPYWYGILSLGSPHHFDKVENILRRNLPEKKKKLLNET